MKRLLLLLSVSIFALYGFSYMGDSETDEGSKAKPSAKVYKKLAKSTCKCVNKSTKGLSSGMIEVIVESGGSEEKMRELMQVYVAKNPERALKEAKLMQGPMVRNMDACLSKLKQKYASIYSKESEEVVQRKLLSQLRKMNGCEISYVFLKLGMQM